jgi:tRNA(Ile2) C34 agmatinyltransferase TiaS
MKKTLVGLLFLAAATSVLAKDCYHVELAKVTKVERIYSMKSPFCPTCAVKEVPSMLHKVTIQLESGFRTLNIRENVRVGQILPIESYDCPSRSRQHTSRNLDILD